MGTLLILAHMDDEAISCGGLIQARRERRMYDLGIVTMFGRKYNYGKGYQYEKEQEADYTKVCEILMGPDRYQVCENFEEGEPGRVGYYQLLESVEHHLRQFRPTEVVTHSPHDLNQDHQHLSHVVDIALRACNLGSVTRILHCLSLDGSSQHQPDYFVKMNSHQLDIKIAAIEAYRTERRATPHARCAENVVAQSKVWGSRVNSQYAEAFELKLAVD